MTLHMPLAGFLGGFGIVELVVLGLIGILLFGKRLPEIGKSLGRTIVEFEKGLNSTGEELNKAVHEGEGPAPTLKAGPSQSKRIAGTSDEP